MSFVQAHYHVVFSTKDRARVLVEEKREDLFRYIWGFMKNKNCTLVRINCVEDHVHLLFSLHATIALSDLMRDLKAATTQWIRTNRILPGFSQWQDGYGAFAVSHYEVPKIVEYIKGQQRHHERVSYREELLEMLERHGLRFDERFVE